MLQSIAIILKQPGFFFGSTFQMFETDSSNPLIPIPPYLPRHTQL